MPKETAVVKQNSGIMLSMSFVIIMVVSAIVIALAHQLFPSQVVLGTMSISLIWAILLSSGAVSLITTFVMPVFSEWEIRNKKMLSPMELMAGYLVVNFAALWLISRASEIFGIGLSSWLVVLILAVVLDFAQGVVMMMVEQVRKK